MDWVERRAERQKALQAFAISLWKDLRTTIGHAIQSYNRLHFGDRGEGFEAVVCGAQYADLIVIALSPLSNTGPQARRVRIERYIEPQVRQPKVTADYDPADTHNPISLSIHLESDDKTCVFLSPEGDRLDAEQASERLLKPLFFPAEAAVDDEERQAAVQGRNSVPTLPRG